MLRKGLLLLVSLITGILTFHLLLASIIVFIPAALVGLAALSGLYISMFTFDAATGLLDLKGEVDTLKKSIEEKRGS